jgi:hypothetical protein
MLLGELVAERLEQRGVPRDGMEWDAWRRNDGAWEVRLEYLADERERSAQWVYDPVRRIVTPDDDDARWLLEEEPAASVTQLRALGRPKKNSADRAANNAADANATEVPVEPQSASVQESVVAKSPRENAIAAATRGQRRTVPDSPPPKKRRASVPSWDEILFGSRKPE